MKRRFITAKIGTILFQSIYRGHATRRVLASIKIQSQARKRKHHVAFIKLKSATISLQCRQRRGVAKKVLAALKHEQKDIGKLKQNNEKLKSEMASLRAMLSAQAKQGAMKMESEKELKEKEAEIKRHMKRIKELEVLLESEKENVKMIETRLGDKEMIISEQQERISILTEQNQNLSLNQTTSHRQSNSFSSSLPPSAPLSPIQYQPSPPSSPRAASFQSFPDNDTKALAAARAQVAKLEKALEAERAERRETESEVIRLRARASGIDLGDDDVKALLPIDKDIKSIVTLPDLDTTISELETHNASSSDSGDR